MGKSTTDITKENFESTITGGGIVLLDWWAPWCSPCRAFAPVYEKVAEKHPDITFGKINTDQEQELAGTFEIRSIPTLMIFRDSVLLFSRPGMVPAEALEDLITQVQKVDMDEVRRKIAEQDKAGASGGDSDSQA